MRLEPLGQIRPSTYNPRAADAERLALVELSLRKLGFLLPIYADPSGEIVSGHQRHLVADRMGLDRVPVERLRPMPLAKRKALNIAFNRGTNDVSETDTPARLTRALAGDRVAELAAELPDLDSGSPAFVRCMAATPYPVASLVRANRGRWITYARNLARSLELAGVRMPAIVDPADRIVNGVGRIQHAAERKVAKWPIVRVSETEARFAEAMLNRLSMDFDLHTRYADLLRHNSFRRAWQRQTCLGKTFVFALLGDQAARDFDVAVPGNAARWRAFYGSTVLDWGAGHLVETRMLRAVGVDCVPFEPYRLAPGNVIDKPASVTVARGFLERVAAGVRFDSIFLAAVLNSVPFRADREHILAILAALCAPHTRVFSVSASAVQGLGRGTGVNFKHSGHLRFVLDYEPNVVVGDIAALPKVQKFHTREEWCELWSTFFRHTAHSEANAKHQMIASGARPIDAERLRAALAFEFDLPYPDGSRMGLAGEAVAAFEQRGAFAR